MEWHRPNPCAITDRSPPAAASTGAAKAARRRRFANNPACANRRYGGRPSGELWRRRNIKSSRSAGPRARRRRSGRRATERQVRPASKLRELPKFSEACVDFGTSQRFEASDAEHLAAETPHDRSINHGAAEVLLVDMALLEIATFLGKVADEPAGETIARTGRVEHLFEQIARHHEMRIAAEQDGAVPPA